MRNIRLVIEYDGSGFFGWQYQPRRRTIQGELQFALEKITGKPTTVYGCSRTDSGVSARNYVANFVTGPGLNPERLRRAVNFHLPRAILVKQAEEAPLDFHARYSAKGKTYQYCLVRGRSPLRSSQAWELRSPVDTTRMRRAMRSFQGRHNFRSFCHLRVPTRNKTGAGPGKPGLSRIAASNAGDCPGFFAFCTLTRLDVSELGDELLITVRGNRFLYKMVRRIVGAVVTYGAGGITLADIRSAIAGRKYKPFPTAPAHGLVLDRVEY